MTMLQLDPHVWAATKQRPPGMRPDVAYEPMLDTRSQQLRNWLQITGIKLWYGLPTTGLITRFNNWRFDGRQAPMQGTPDTSIALPTGGYKVAVMGDMGEGSRGQELVAARVLEWKPTHVATLGDNVYPLGREVDYARRFDPQFGALMASASWRPALGNHDYFGGDLRPYFKRFSATQGAAYYSWSLGPADFFVLDSEQRLDADSAQRAWLEQQLASSTAKYRVVQVHRPLVSTGTQSGHNANYGSLAPLLAKYGVQLVLAGHEHGYERSQAIDGTVHIVSGGGGADMLPSVAPLPDQTVARTRRYHYVQLGFDDDQMVVRAVDTDGAVLDSTRISPSSGRSDAARGVRELIVR